MSLKKTLDREWTLRLGAACKPALIHRVTRFSWSIGLSTMGNSTAFIPQFIRQVHYLARIYLHQRGPEFIATKTKGTFALPGGFGGELSGTDQ